MPSQPIHAQVNIVNNGRTFHAPVTPQNDSRAADRKGPAADRPDVAHGNVSDQWRGLSRDMIERFIDVSCLERPLTRSTRRGHRADLVGLDWWMQRNCGRTLISAISAELWEYLEERRTTRVEQRLLRRLQQNMQLFYAYLCHCGCRNDDPTRNLRIAFQQSHYQAPSFGRLQRSGAEGR